MATKRLIPWLLACAVLQSAVAELAPELTDAQHLAQIEQTDQTDEAIRKGLAWLAQKQDATDGSFPGGLKNTQTALACIAFMAAGHFPGRSIHGDSLRRGILFLCREVDKQQGYLGRDGGRMYGHGICTLALVEAYGMMARDEDNAMLKQALDKALAVTLNAQIQVQGPHHGGWRYEPTSTDADLSVTAWQVLTLRAAQNCGLAVPEEAVAHARDYVRRTFNAAGGGFSYQGGGPSPAMQAAGVVCMLALKSDEDPEDAKRIAKSAEFLLTVDPANGGHFYYQSYYFATAANMFSDESRNALLPKLEAVLVKLQAESGEFAKHQGYDGGVYATAFAVICLAVRYQFLPIYQE